MDILVIGLFLFAEGLFLIVPLSTDTDTQYLLSAMSQALAALFALVFTIVLLISQMASTHSHRLVDSVFERTTRIYMAFFILAIIVPFIALKTSLYRSIFVWISGTFAIACIICLIPFMLSVKEDLKIESLVARVSRENVKKINSELRGKYEEYHLTEAEDPRRNTDPL